MAEGSVYLIFHPHGEIRFYGKTDVFGLALVLLASICPNNSYSSFLYYSMLLKESSFKAFNDEGTVFGSITKDDLLRLEIPIPSKTEIEEFEMISNLFDKCIETNEQEIVSLKSILDLLMKEGVR